MRSLKIIVYLFFIGMCFSCDNNDTLTQEEEAQNLSNLFEEIESLATSKNCEDPAEWTFTSYGSKACGGPVGYIPYSTKIDTKVFLEKIEEHRTAQEQYNEKWGIISDCSLPAQPKGVACEGGNAILEY